MHDNQQGQEQEETNCGQWNARKNFKANGKALIREITSTVISIQQNENSHGG